MKTPKPYAILDCTKKVHNELKRNVSRQTGRVYFAYSPSGIPCLAIRDKNGEEKEIPHSASLIWEEGTEKVLNLVKSWGYPYDARMELWIRNGVIE